MLVFYKHTAPKIVFSIGLFLVSTLSMASGLDQKAQFSVMENHRFDGRPVFCVRKQGDEPLKLLELKSKIGAISLLSRNVEVSGKERIKDDVYTSDISQHFTSISPGNIDVTYSYFEAGVCASISP